MLDTLLMRFADGAPVALMAGGLLERFLSRDELDAWFERTAERQYTRELLFSTVFELMSQVVCGMQPSVHAAYQKHPASIGVSLASLYNKLNGIEPAVSAGVVRYSAQQMAPVIAQLHGARPPDLPGYHLKILDGNCLAATEHRLEPLRRRPAAALPGKSLVVYDPALEMVLEVVCCADAYTQERALLEPLYPTIRPRDVWVADRNFCTREFLQQIVQRGAFFLIRQHANLPWEPASLLVEVGRSDTGVVYEQTVRLRDEKGEVFVQCRRIVVRLDRPTRDGEYEIAILCSVPKADAPACRVAELYRGRWRIEGAFAEVERNLRSEVNTLAYPGAALFGFCLALVAYNILAVVKAALRAVHGVDVIDQQISGYYLSIEFASTYRGMMIAIPPEHWAIFREASVPQLAELLLTLAEQVQLRQYRKHRRGPKKPATKKAADPAEPHVSTARVLAQYRGAG